MLLGSKILKTNEYSGLLLKQNITKTSNLNEIR